MAEVKEDEYGNRKAKRKSEDPPEVPAKVKEAVDGSARAIAGLEPIWEQAMAFFGNDQHVFVHATTNNLDRMETREGGAKPAHRPRLQSNRMTMQVVSEASLLSARTPGYQAVAPNHDPARRNQARLAEKALLAEHQRLGLDIVGLETIIHAINTGAGFTWPYWDPGHGDLIGEVEGDVLYQGDIRIMKLHQGEVLWAAGLPFDDSPWVCVRKAQGVEDVKGRRDYIGPDNLAADAKAGLWERPGNSKGELVFVYEYLEKPCAAYPKGRWLTWANDHLIREPADYPRASGGPVIHRLPWIPQPGKHRDLGAGEQLVDVQRMINRIVNQIIAWRNLILRPQLLAPKGSIETDPTDEDGVIYEYNPVGGTAPIFREVPEIPQSLFQDLDRCYEQMDHILGMRELPTGVEAASAIEAANDREQSSRGIFVRGLAAWWAGQGHHVVELIQANYNEPRLLELQGRRGVELIEDFVGHQLGRPGTIIVSEASVEPRTKQAMEAKIMMYAQMGWITGHQAMAAINGGTAEALIDDYELDVQRQYREIDEIEALQDWTPELEAQRAMQLWVDGGNDPELMPPGIAAQPPIPMAEDYDNHQVHMDVLKQWMKTREFELLPDLAKQAARNHLSQHMFIEQQAMQQQLMERAQLAQSIGEQNATRQPGPKQPGDQNKEPGMKTQLAGGAANPSGG